MKNELMIYRRNERAEHKHLCVEGELLVKPAKNVLMNVELRKAVGVAKIAPTTQFDSIPISVRGGLEHLLSRVSTIEWLISSVQHSELGFL
jgi:hypothetical protein